MGKFSFFKDETFGLRNQVTFIGNECKIYIPKSFFENEYATEMGDKVETVGIFYFEADKEKHRFQYPLKITFQFREKEEKTLKIIPECKSDKFVIFTLNKGDAFIWDKKVKQDVANIQFLFNKLLESGKIPYYIPYDEIVNFLIGGIKATDSGFMGVSSISFEFLISEVYRGNDGRAFRFSFKDKSDNYSYKTQRLNSITRSVGTFTSIIGEDINTGIISSVLRTREKQEEDETVLEKVIKY